jgi:hypothetical protein
MAKTLIGNIKGKNGRGITSIKKTGTTGSVDTYTITYTDDTTSTFTINNSDSISLQRQIVPSAAVESSAIASQAYAAGGYVVVNGVLRKVKSAIAKGNTISDSNSTATTVGGELESIGPTLKYTTLKLVNNLTIGTGGRDLSVTWPVDFSRIKHVTCRYAATAQAAVLVAANWDENTVLLRANVAQEYNITLAILYV